MDNEEKNEVTIVTEIAGAESIDMIDYDAPTAKAREVENEENENEKE